MKQRKFTNGITFFTSADMYEKLKGISDERNVGISEFLRDIIGEYLAECADNKLYEHDSMISATSKGDRVWKN